MPNLLDTLANGIRDFLDLPTPKKRPSCRVVKTTTLTKPPSAKPPSTARQTKPRNPVFGSLKGKVFVKQGYDLTKPTFFLMK